MTQTTLGLASCTALLLFFTACAGSGSQESDVPAATGTLDASPDDSEQPAESSTSTDKGDKDDQRGGDGGGSDGDDVGPSAETEASGDDSEGSAPAASGGTGPAEQTAGSTSAHPAVGTYLYSQQGYEEFCNRASCDRSDLPARQGIHLRLVGSSADGDEVLSTIDGEGDRLVRTTTVYSGGSAHVTEVYVRMGYQGFVFENRYRPSPPVEVLRFPLKTGDAWSGSWKADTSGSYEARVVDREVISVGGRDFRAFKVSTTTTFRGEFEGSSDAQVWIDPDTRAVLRTSGLLRLKTDLGGYNTAFQTDLISGPGYR